MLEGQPPVETVRLIQGSSRFGENTAGPLGIEIPRAPPVETVHLIQDSSRFGENTAKPPRIEIPRGPAISEFPYLPAAK